MPHVSSDYGPRPRPKPGASTFHRGLDLTGFSSILAAGDGIVIGAGVIRGWEGGGLQVVIDHGNGVVTRYMHLASISTSVGKRATRGVKIGVMGKTGTATGVHLHFEVRLNGVSVDPATYLPPRLPATATSTVVNAGREVKDKLTNKQGDIPMDGIIVDPKGNYFLLDSFGAANIATLKDGGVTNGELVSMANQYGVKKLTQRNFDLAAMVARRRGDANVARLRAA